MTIKRLSSLLLLLGVAGAMTFTAQASYPEYSDVDNFSGASPSAPQAIAFPLSDSTNTAGVINNILQEERVNINMEGAEAGLYKVLRSDQKNAVNDYTTRIFPVNNADPREMRNVLRRVAGLEGGNAEIIIDKDGGNAIQVNAPTYMIPYIEKAVQSLDVKWLLEYFDGAADIYIKMKHREAAQVDAIAQFYAGSELFNGNSYDDPGFTTVDGTNNALRRFGSEYRNAEYANAVEMVDVPTNQVNLSVKIYEITATNDLKLGLDYIAWKNGPGRTLFTFAEGGFEAYTRASGAAFSPFDPFGPHPSLFSGADNFQNFPQQMTTLLHAAGTESYRATNYLLTSSFVDFLRVKNLARTIREANVTVTSSNRATISSVEQILSIESGSSLNPSDTYNPSGESGPSTDLYNRFVNYTKADQNIGLTLDVTPYVGLESMELDIELDVDEVAGLTPAGTPIINTRSLITSVRLLDGQPFVIAGLGKKNEDKGTAKAPVLGSLPLVGYLAGGETDLNRASEMVITITPTFVLGSQSSDVPARVETVKMIINGDAPQGMPEIKYGFDQWLLGS